MANTLDNIIDNYNSEELLDLYNSDDDHQKFQEIIQEEIDEIAEDDVIDEDEQEKIDALFAQLDEVGVVWDEQWQELNDLETGDMTDAEKGGQEGLMENIEEIMDVLKEATSVAEDRVDTINESVIEIGDEGGKVEVTEDTNHDITVQCNGNSDPFASASDGLIYSVSDDETNILEEGRIPITVNTPELTLQSWDGGNAVFTFEGEDEDGEVVTRTITFKDYDPKKYVIYFEGDSITQDMVDSGKLASWHTDILGSSVFGDDQWSLNVRVNGPKAWDEFATLTGDATINQAIGFVPEASGLSEAIKTSWDTLWQGYIDGDVDSAWKEVTAQYPGDQQKALIKALTISMALDSKLAKFYGTFFNSYVTTLESHLDVDYENPTPSDLLALMVIEEFTTSGGSLGGPSLYAGTLFGDGTIEGEVKKPEVAIEAMNNLMDLSALSGHTLSSSLDDALEIQTGIVEDGGYFKISDDQYDAMVSQIMGMKAGSDSGVGGDTQLRNALIQALDQLQAKGSTTVEDARNNILTICNSFSSFGESYVDDVTAGLLYLLMTSDGGSPQTPSNLYTSVVDDYTFMARIEPLINNGEGKPVFYNEIKDDFKSRGYEFTKVEEPVPFTPIYDTVWDGAIGGMLAGVGIALGIAFIGSNPVGWALAGVIALGAGLGFFSGGMVDKAVKSATTWAKDAWDAITFWD